MYCTWTELVCVLHTLFMYNIHMLAYMYVHVHRQVYLLYVKFPSVGMISCLCGQSFLQLDHCLALWESAAPHRYSIQSPLHRRTISTNSLDPPLSYPPSSLLSPSLLLPFSLPPSSLPPSHLPLLPYPLCWCSILNHHA